MNIILFSDTEISQPLTVRDKRAQHILKILHKTEGDTFEAGIINGKAGTARITEQTADFLRFEFTPQHDSKPLFPLILAVGFPRPIQLKRLLRDVSSLGVCAVHLTGTQLGEKSYLNSTLVDRGAATEGLLDGAVQAKTTHIPLLYMHKTLPECVDAAQNMTKEPHNVLIQPPLTSAHCVKLLLDNVKPDFALSDKAVSRSFAGKTVIAAVGSERGWTDEERLILTKQGFISCSMGSRILRTETAAVTAVSLILCGMNVI